MRKIKFNSKFWKDLNFWLGFAFIALFIQSFFPIPYSWETRILCFLLAVILLFLSFTEDNHHD
ncbi:hypothetical protein FAM18168_00119 [Lacticaseibacillus paracasei]|nr:hypothetical protein FAM18149p_13510 [Lacticaseibacillus paracasei]RND79260.1 hypothetical protein FAM18149_00166 [Lacticaseibacillus paracasei]RND86851.1 hypothetical protein FAM18168_00119 [Lacticaseibacillus paracasei]